MSDGSIPRTPDCKVVMLGKASCGKTCLANRYINGTYTQQVMTVGMAFLAKDVQVGDRQFQLAIWDTAGSERFQSITPMYYRGATVALLCYSVEDSDSLDRIDFWYDQLARTEPDCAVFVVGTKVDIIGQDSERAVSLRTQVASWADGKGISSERLFTTSALSGAGVKELFDAVAVYCADHLQHAGGDSQQDSHDNGKNSKNSGKCCVIM